MVKRLLISGRVQGVGYRDSMYREATRLGARGWVRNRFDGTVEAMVDGSPEAIETLIAWARRGPPAADVNAIRIEECAEDCTAFAIRPTA